MGQGFYIKTSSGKAARTSDAHRLLAAMKRQHLKGMSVATPGSGNHYKAHLLVGLMVKRRINHSFIAKHNVWDMSLMEGEKASASSTQKGSFI